jgi:hypothetical protein
MGLEGNYTPIMTHDFEAEPLNHKNVVDPFGFRYGFRGVEMQRPLIDAIFRPDFVTLNLQKGAAGLMYRGEETRYAIFSTILKM